MISRAFLVASTLACASVACAQDTSERDSATDDDPDTMSGADTAADIEEVIEEVVESSEQVADMTQALVDLLRQRVAAGLDPVTGQPQPQVANP